MLSLSLFVETAEQAALALKPLTGDFTFILFSLGIIGTGLLAVPILAGSAAYAASVAFGWKEGLYHKFKKPHGFYGIITIATLFGLCINLKSIKPFNLLYFTAVLNGLAAPPLMILIMLISNNKKIMGKHKNGIFENLLGWVITGIMSVASLGLVISIFMNK